MKRAGCLIDGIFKAWVKYVTKDDLADMRVKNILYDEIDVYIHACYLSKYTPEIDLISIYMMK